MYVRVVIAKGLLGIPACWYWNKVVWDSWWQKHLPALVAFSIVTSCKSDATAAVPTAAAASATWWRAQ